MIVIADTSPINYLVRIGEIDLLPTLFGRVVLPMAVCRELQDPLAPDAVRRWISNPPDWVDVRATRLTPDTALLRADLDAGEQEAILLALELDAGQLIIDDLDGRREAERRKLTVTGTIGVLRAASRMGAANLRDALDRLRGTNFHLSQHFYDQLIAEAALLKQARFSGRTGATPS